MQHRLREGFRQEALESRDQLVSQCRDDVDLEVRIGWHRPGYPSDYNADLRVIAGKFRSRRLKTLPGRVLRPTSDRLRETLFNVLGEQVIGRVFIDAYAGSGAVGIEALSRGAERAVFAEKDCRAVALIRENLRALGLEDRAQVVAGEAAKALRRVSADIVFLDPPYGDISEYEQALKLLGELRPELVVAEHSRRLQLAESYGQLRRTRVLTQGDSALSFYSGSERRRRPVA